MNVVIFGVGNFFMENIDKLPQNINVIAFIDNNEKLWGTQIDGVQVFSPEKINNLEYDYIILMSIFMYQMKKQLIELNVDEQKILYWDKYYANLNRGILKSYINDWNLENKKKILIITDHLKYNGGALVAVYAYKALKQLGYEVVLATAEADLKFIDELQQERINIIVSPSLPCIHNEERMWINIFDLIIVNVFPMLESACKIIQDKPVLWWMHESSAKHSVIYPNILAMYSDSARKEILKKINIIAVSEIAKNNFNYYFPNEIKNTLLLGIPDIAKDTIKNQNSKEKIVFAIIGAISEIKGHHEFVKALSLLESEEKNKIECWIIGNITKGKYCENICKIIEKESYIKLKGPLTREEIHKAYEKIDVVVCPSLEETMSIAVIEGLMYSKVCVCSDNTGICDYIEDGINGIICKAGDEKNLADKLKWIINNYEVLDNMRHNARKTYEEYFTMESFATRLEVAVKETIQKYYD